MDKDLIEDKLYQMLHKFSGKEITHVKLNLLIVQKIKKLITQN